MFGVKGTSFGMYPVDFYVDFRAVILFKVPVSYYLKSCVNMCGYSYTQLYAVF